MNDLFLIGMGVLGGAFAALTIVYFYLVNTLKGLKRVEFDRDYIKAMDMAVENADRMRGDKYYNHIDRQLVDVMRRLVDERKFLEGDDYENIGI